MKKIIFVEDDSMLQKVLTNSLKESGYETKQAFDGKEGLSKIKEERFDLILLDLILPKLDGFELLKRLREDSKNKETPVIVLTNLEEPTDIEKMLELGATTYLVKSDQSLEDIVAKVKRVFE